MDNDGPGAPPVAAPIRVMIPFARPYLSPLLRRFAFPTGRYCATVSARSLSRSGPVAICGGVWLCRRRSNSRHTSEKGNETPSAHGVATGVKAKEFSTFNVVTTGAAPSASATRPTSPDSVRISRVFSGPACGSNVTLSEWIISAAKRNTLAAAGCA